MVTEALFPREAVREVERRLAAAGCPDAGFDARELFRLATGRDARLSEQPLAAKEAARLEALCARRERREPLQYLCGSWPFLDFALAVGPGVLCPRADTEIVAEEAARLVQGLPQPRVLDLCAGTGCLGLGVKRFCPSAEVVCVEKSGDAFVYLEKNVRSALCGAGSGKAKRAFDGPDSRFVAPAATAVRGDVFTYWQILPAAPFDLIVSNPPYLTSAEMRRLQPEVAYEPAMALAAGEDGLDFYCVIAGKYKSFLKPGGALALEIGWQQREAVTALLRANGWQDVACKKDYAGNDRCVTAKAPRSNHPADPSA